MAERLTIPVETRDGEKLQRYSQNVTLTYLAPENGPEDPPESHGWFVVYYTFTHGNQVEPFYSDYDLAVERYEELVKQIG